MQGVSNKRDGIAVDSLMSAAARQLAAGDPLGALKRVALRDDAPALALRGIAMAQVGELDRAAELLQSAARGFGAREPLARARCMVARAEIALVARDLGRSIRMLGSARTTLVALGDRTNAAHAGYLEARWLLLIGRLDQAERTLGEVDVDALPQASRAGHALVAAGIAMRRVRTEAARGALDRAAEAARESGIAVLVAEVAHAFRALDAPAARLILPGGERLLRLDEVEALLDSDTLIVDVCRNVARARGTTVPLGGRPVLLALARALAEAWPEGVSREALLSRIFRLRQTGESHRARLRVEIGRLRRAIEPLAILSATRQGFALEPREAATVAVLAPPIEGDHAEVLALLADGEAWSSSALALALGVSPRTALRALRALAHTGRTLSFGRGRACRWIASEVPGFPTTLLLPATALAG